MENQNTNGKINYRSMIQSDAWIGIFHAISRLITVEEDLCGDNVKALQGLYDLAEEVEGRVLEKPVSKSPR
ncbi:MAG: hypothetical protein FWD97_02780 [Defluviitaleaceae bacterium]|nr:hypothetical protein [Defluviitaleaceae bacterium]